jgi:predicted amidohydrolase
MKISAILAPFPVSLSIQSNLERIDTVLAQATPGAWVVLPEGAISGYSTDIEFLKQVDPHAVDAGLAHVHAEARRRELTVWVGACVYEDGNWFNSAHGFCADGTDLEYRKINLANHERGVLTAGNSLPVFDVCLPDGTVRVGLQICRELRYPEQWGWLARRGAQVILHLNNAVGADTFQPVWRSHLVSRAAETQRYVLSVNNAADRQVCPTLAVAPDGKILAEAVSGEAGMLRVELDLSTVSNWNLNQCREDVVKIEAKGTSGLDE